MRHSRAGDRAYVVTLSWAEFTNGEEGTDLIGVFSARSKARDAAAEAVKRSARDLDSTGRISWTDTGTFCRWNTLDSVHISAWLHPTLVR